MKHKIMLGDKDFARLVEGKVVQVEVQPDHFIDIALSDIGFARMGQLIAHAEAAPRKSFTSTSSMGGPERPIGGRPPQA